MYHYLDHPIPRPKSSQLFSMSLFLCLSLYFCPLITFPCLYIFPSSASVSVTRCWNKKPSQSFQKLLKKKPKQFLQKSNAFQSSSKRNQIYGQLLQEFFLPRTVTKCNIWSHWTLSLLAILFSLSLPLCSQSSSFPFYRHGFWASQRQMQVKTIDRKKIFWLSRKRSQACLSQFMRRDL